MFENFLVCRPCGLISPLAIDEPHTCAEDTVDDPGDLETFRYEHALHGLEHATRLPTPAVYDRPVWDPMATAFFEITINGEVFLVRSWRTSIEEPRCRQLIGGVIQRGSPVTELDQRYLRSALDRHFHPHVLADSAVDRIVATVTTLVGTIDANALETSFDDADDPEVSIAPLPDGIARKLRDQSSGWFDAMDSERFGSFVEANRLEDGALAVRIRRPMIVVPG